MHRAELETQYRRYIDCLNQRRLDELGRFVQPDVVHNGRRLGLAGYREMIAGDIAAVPDLRFEIRFLTLGDGFIGCRLEFDCTPAAPFQGLQPNGRRISFAEHVFYNFRDDRIAEVWSLIDKAAIAQQLSH